MRCSLLLELVTSFTTLGSKEHMTVLKLICSNLYSEDHNSNADITIVITYQQLYHIHHLHIYVIIFHMIRVADILYHLICDKHWTNHFNSHRVVLLQGHFVVMHYSNFTVIETCISKMIDPGFEPRMGRFLKSTKCNHKMKTLCYCYTQFSNYIVESPFKW